MKHFCYSCFLILLVVAQALLPHFWLGVKPNFLVMFVLCIAILEGPVSGSVYAGIVGIILDTMGFLNFGVNTLFLLLFASLCGLLYGIYFTYNYLVGALFVGAISILYELFYYVFAFLLWGARSEWSVFTDLLFPQGLYHLVFGFFIFLITMQMMRKFSIQKG